MDNKKRSFFVWLASLILSALIVLLAVFGEWFGIDYLGNTTPLKVAKLITQFSDWFYTDLGGLTVAATFIYIALGIVAISCVYTLKSLHNARIGGARVSISLFVAAIALSIVVILSVAIGNLSINSETDIGLHDILHLTATPFLVLILGIVGGQLNSKYRIERFDFSSINVQSAFKEAPAAKEELYCPTCKKAAPAGGKFCATCGAELVPMTRPCPQCGKPLAQGAAFCSYCGCKADEPRAESTEYVCKCGNKIADSALRFCPQCGAAIQRN